ncbi:hypothetical protein H5410_024097 [Solanum commersonii]|uniref:Uncharacterized protein n=1 Tax=Solanum commersonii TaxID=4109 RepID=A0A9J5ZL21_SOLCO|nr:hypothetical protein H5410_024097 [Solanum commersonii]
MRTVDSIWNKNSQSRHGFIGHKITFFFNVTGPRKSLKQWFNGLDCRFQYEIAKQKYEEELEATVQGDNHSTLRLNSISHVTDNKLEIV